MSAARAEAVDDQGVGPATFDPPRRGRGQWVRNVVLLLLTAGAIAGAYFSRASTEPPKRFGVVEPGRLYRSGEPTLQQLEYVVRQHHIRTVVSLLDPNTPESRLERAAAEALGVAWKSVPLPGDGASTPEQREQIKKLLLDDAAGPTLVHCAAGSSRTGLAVGLYRMNRQHWTCEQVLEEMKDYGFRDKEQNEELRAALRGEAEAVKRSSNGE